MASAAEIFAGLVARGVPAHVAQGIVPNMQAESGLDTGINELAPTVPGSRGGYGLNQWTGPRRVQYEQFAAAQGKDPSDLNTQLDFTVWELHNTEKAAGDAILSAPDARTAARLYETKFLRPGVPHGDRGGIPLAPASAPQNGLAGQQYVAPPVNQLAALRPVQLDPAAFMSRRYQYPGVA